MKKWFTLSLFPYLYLFFGIGWLLWSDHYLPPIHFPFNDYVNTQTLKGLVFILFSFVLMLMVIKKNKEVVTIEEEKNKLTTLINAMPDFVLFKDGKGRWIQVNDFGRQLFELQHVDYRGKTDSDLAKLTDFYHDALLYCVDSDEIAWQIGKISRVEEVVPKRDGSFRTFDTIKLPLFNHDGSRKAFIVIGRDITEHKKTEDLLLQSEKLTVLGELAAGVAHEIRNPLTSIKGFLQFMDEEDETKKLYKGIMISEIDRINDIVTELLLLSRPQDVEFKNQDVESILHYVTSLIKTETTLKSLEIEFINKANHPIVYGSANQLKQVFLNIVKNAIEASHENDKISIKLEQNKQNELVATFLDHGTGIDEERLKTIGQPFYTTKEKGFGLGMTVSYKIIKEHKGRIDIKSKVDKGTEVKVILPISVGS
ncbi:ATP-binding protein [Metabacillus herbersteinensis]|uniref:histidine kinase n=1 Tax=Metabacillus herbersteinensis TaxID=283816 RepID=A0ABV6GGC8_9BACI